MLSTVGTHRKNTSKDSKHEERSSQEESQNEVVGERVTEQFPDGGLRAWVVVIGVRVVLSLQSTNIAENH